MINSVELARKIRVHAVRMTGSGGSSHVGPCLSIADIVAVLYSGALSVNPQDPRWSERDRFILSKGHSGAAVYAALAESGFFSTEKLLTHYQNGSDLSGHVSHKGVPGVEFSTGSLGHGLSVGAGIALGAKLDGRNYRTVVLLSDGECDEGSNWEAILFAAHHRLGRLLAIVDYNKVQSLKSVAETLGLEPFAEKWRSFGWDCVEVNGHDHAQIRAAIERVSEIDGTPRCIIANTVKGKGVSFMENSILWHYRSPKGEELVAALQELGATP